MMPQNKNPIFCRIIATVCLEYGVTREELLGDDRHKRYTTPRHLAYAVARDILEWSYPDLGRAFGMKDHTSILYGCRKVWKREASDEAFLEYYNGLKERLRPDQDRTLPGVKGKWGLRRGRWIRIEGLPRDKAPSRTIEYTRSKRTWRRKR